MRPRIAVVGSVNLDLVVECERLPLPGETISGETLREVPGGKGANQAVAAARLGADVTLIACTGEDTWGDGAEAELRLEGIDTTHMVSWSGLTGVALILVSRAGENQIVVVPGANGALVPENVEVSGYHGVMSQLEIPIETVAAAAEGADGLFCLNASPAMEMPDRVLERANLVVVNRHELDAIGDPAALRLVAVTMGEEGAVLLERGREIARAKPPKIDAVDGTAAGDAFCSALFVGLLERRSHQHALERACAAGALAASRFGARPSLPTDAEVDEILRR